MEKERQFIIDRMKSARGDDLYRAECAFRGHNLDELYGQSGRTKRQILEEYRQFDNEWIEAMKWLEEE